MTNKKGIFDTMDLEKECQRLKAEVGKVIEKEATELWNDIYKEKVEIDDLTSVIQILTDRIKKRLGIK